MSFKKESNYFFLPANTVAALYEQLLSCFQFVAAFSTARLPCSSSLLEAEGLKRKKGEELIFSPALRCM